MPHTTSIAAPGAAGDADAAAAAAGAARGLRPTPSGDPMAYTVPAHDSGAALGAEAGTDAVADAAPAPGDRRAAPAARRPPPRLSSLGGTSSDVNGARYDRGSASPAPPMPPTASYAPPPAPGAPVRTASFVRVSPATAPTQS